MNDAAIERWYERCADQPLGTSPHLATLRAYASRCDVAAELGCRHGHSASALILGARKRAWSIDITPTRQARELQALAGGMWTYVIGDSRTADVPACDLLFVDSRHTYDQVDAELRAHAGKAGRYLIFHDTITFGSVGEDGGLGIRPAIDQFMACDPTWRIVEHRTNSHGLLVLAREGEYLCT